MNELVTKFIFDDKDSLKIDSVLTKLQTTDRKVNELGKTANFGTKLNVELTKSAEGFGKLGKEVDSLKTKTETFNARPTISRYYENEAAEVKKSVASINREVASLNAPRNNPGKLSLERIASGIGDDGISRVRPKISIDYGESRFNTPAHFDKTIKTPGDGGNLKLSSFQKTNLSYQINDVLTGLASGQKPTQILAQQGGQIAQIFSPSQITAFTAAYGGLVSILGAGTIAIAATYKITGDLRAEAERRLKVEETIAGTINRQILGQQEALRLSKEQQITAEKNFYFQRDLKTGSKEQLERQLTTARLLLNYTPPTIKTYDGSGKLTEKTNEEYTRRNQEVLELQARLRELPFEKNDRLARAFDQHNEDFKRNQENEREAEKQATEKRKLEAERLFKLKDDFRETLINSVAKDNPFVKTISDIETATERAQAKFGAFGAFVVKKIADIEKANLTKALGLQRFENNLDALKFNQEATRLFAAPDRSFADFKRALEKVNATAEFTTNINSLNRQISEADYYAGKYNPNNPKSYAEFNRRGSRDDISDTGLQIRDAIADIRDLSKISVGETGIYGKGAVADKILASIPSRDELLKRLNSSDAAIRGDASFLLSQQAESLRVKRDFEKQKFSDFIEDQRAAEFGKRFAREQIDLVNGSNLTDAEKAKRRLSITDALGDDLDAGLKRQRIQDFIAAGKDKLAQEKEAILIATETRDAVNAIVKALTGQGIKIHDSSLAASNTNVTITSDRSDVRAELQPAATSSDTADRYYDENTAIGATHRAGSLYGTRLG